MKKFLTAIFSAILISMNPPQVHADALQDSLNQVKRQCERIVPMMWDINAVRIVDTGAESFLEDILKASENTPVEFTDVEYFPNLDINGGFLTIWISAFDRENPNDTSEYMDNPDGAISFIINGEGYISMISVSQLESSRDPKIYYETIDVILKALGMDELEKVELLASSGEDKNAYCSYAGRRIHFIGHGNVVAIFATEY